MIPTFDGSLGYTDPAITEREAICVLHEAYPHATLEPVEGYPNLMGWFLFKVFDRPNGIPRRVYVTHDGEAIEVDNNLPLTTFKEVPQ
jgi:hypothetical protein